jgi:hypothetical protein
MPRKQADEATAEPTPPGPNILDVRVNGKVQLSVRVHDVNFDQQTHQVIITGELKPKATDKTSDEPLPDTR